MNKRIPFLVFWTVAVLVGTILIAIGLVTKEFLNKPIASETLYQVMPFGSETIYVRLGEIRIADKKVSCTERNETIWEIDHDASMLIEVVQ